MTPDEFYQTLTEENLPITEEKMNQFKIYYDLLVEWNNKINLTAITDEQEVYLKHFYDSLSLAKYHNFDDSISLCDVGSGAGFPSIPLKILFPSLEITIVDSLQKRINFLDLLTSSLSLDSVYLYHDRAENFGQNKEHRESFDFVTARAVARMSVLSELCLPLVKPGGYFLAMKASGGSEEMKIAEKAITVLGGKSIEDIAFELPKNAGERHIYVIKKVKKTPKKYPRQSGTPNKSPIE